MTGSGFSITLVTDRRRMGAGGLPSLARAAAAAGVDYVQVREKDLGGRMLLALVREVTAAVAGTPCSVLVNGRPDVAERAGARGVQLPERGLPVADVRRAFARLLIGASCHSLDAAVAAEAAGADFVLLGPVFETPGKEGAPLGLHALADVARRLRVPVHAIGGIDAANASEAVAAGARGLAAIRPFLTGRVAEAAAALRGAGPRP